MKTPTLEEVKKYFKNAKEVKCLLDNHVYDISKMKKDIELLNDSYRCYDNNNEEVLLWSCVKRKYAEIISYKEEIEKPLHYKTDSIDVIDFCKIYDLNFNIGNIIKYVCRAGKKGDRLEDLYKAKDYLEREIKHYEK